MPEDLKEGSQENSAKQRLGRGTYAWVLNLSMRNRRSLYGILQAVAAPLLRQKCEFPLLPYLRDSPKEAPISPSAFLVHETVTQMLQ